MPCITLMVYQYTKCVTIVSHKSMRCVTIVSHVTGGMSRPAHAAQPMFIQSAQLEHTMAAWCRAVTRGLTLSWEVSPPSFASVSILSKVDHQILLTVTIFSKLFYLADQERQFLSPVTRSCSSCGGWIWSRACSWRRPTASCRAWTSPGPGTEP